MTPSELLLALRPLLAAECAAEAPAAGTDPDELAQAVWARLLACPWQGRPNGWPPPHPARWLRAAVRAEARAARRRAAREAGYGSYGARTGPRGHGAGEPGEPGPDAESRLLAAERREVLHSAVRRLPGRCPALLAALFSGRDLTYPEIARELGISQGSVGPLRSRCLAHLRRMLEAGIAAPERRGMLR